MNYIYNDNQKELQIQNMLSLSVKYVADTKNSNKNYVITFHDTGHNLNLKVVSRHDSDESENSNCSATIYHL